MQPPDDLPPPTYFDLNCFPGLPPPPASVCPLLRRGVAPAFSTDWQRGVAAACGDAAEAAA
eukprot:361689-Chlamydomonas_euryale.AAC.7